MKLAELLSVMSKDEAVLVANEGHGVYGQHLIYNSVSKISMEDADKYEVLRIEHPMDKAYFIVYVK
ncbi:MULTISPECIES: hypothetical protein [Faecalibacterium]|jgi:hypothetical protein|uniref:hypothetical protein n=1 Tax=Faecalibacterium TaxID=216851 RepID=UPI000E4F66E5|nr:MULTISPECIES: hypothetical protein [Faecalibacterium]RHQ27585.1 hypothetical protein DWY95_08515 [Faecalibacterium sp. AF28-13AC]DAR20054.1 MAG TPA: hypothetical protein [Bacteriophage sp.]